MKTRILTLAALFLMTANIVSADNFRTFKMSDRMGRTFEVFTKIESNIQETFEFDTREVFEEVKQENNQMIDITPFIKPEREVKETHPVIK
ncbi:MAG: hypothetical protein ACOC0R_04840 [Mariniphaga sp.]